MKKLVCENEELPQSTSLTAPCRREPTVEYTSNCSHISNKTATNILFNGKLTLASLRQGGGKIEDFDGGSSPFSESYFHVEREDGILPYGVGANNVR